MLSAFRMGLATSGRGRCDTDSIIQSYLITCQTIWKSWHGEYILIIIKIEKDNLSVYFRRARTFRFFGT